jgi:hypothetical protein
MMAQVVKLRRVQIIDDQTNQIWWTQRFYREFGFKYLFQNLKSPTNQRIELFSLSCPMLSHNKSLLYYDGGKPCKTSANPGADRGKSSGLDRKTKAPN